MPKKLTSAMLNQFAAQLKAEGDAEGYKRAIRDAKREIIAALDRLSGGATLSMQKASRTPAQQPRVRKRAQSDQQRVLDLIRERPGLRGVDIAQELAKQDPPVLERTVRTALNRLKYNDEIFKIDEGWHPTTTRQALALRQKEEEGLF